MIQLGVNIDHIATIRQARKTYEPDPVLSVNLVETGGADGITVHLREDRRHIQDRDVRILKEVVAGKLNLEMSTNDEIVDIALSIKPDQITLVPEKREEITTEGGLDCLIQYDALSRIIPKFLQKGIEVSIFIDALEEQIEAAKKLGADRIELHTGAFANLYYDARGKEESAWTKERDRLFKSANFAHNQGLRVSAGHGLNYFNIKDIRSMPELTEVNIGHAIIARSVFTGIQAAVREMKDLLG